jgi:hypothetical protein
MQGSDFDEEAFFRAIHASGARALLIGRQALIVLGLPVMTSDYDFWIHFDDIERFNEAVVPLGLFPSHTPAEARARGRYVLESDEHVDVLLSRSRTTTEGHAVSFDGIWIRRQTVPLGDGGAPVSIPSIDDLILTKRFAARPRDAEDIRLLESLRDARSRG